MYQLVSIVAGLVAALALHRVARARHWGLFGDLVLGLLGALLGGLLLRLATRPLAAGAWEHFVVSVSAGAATLAALRAAGRRIGRPRVGAADAGSDGATAGFVARERHLLERLLRRERVARDPNVAFEAQLTLGQRVADRVASFGGSWPFIGLFAAVLLVWISWNVEAPERFDPYPFILLNLLLSCLAALQAPVIMMSQNRMAAKDRLDARHDYEVNLKAEIEIMALHAKLDELVAQRWQELLATQERQVASLERIERSVAARPA